ncbi:helix-turn-helix transcriptional regulator [Caulobacter sp.]|uniref:helix-turn-helix domain-containing protein n=1 Tax=Caulobacter sp. TaxID=78 RepID=UPI001B07BEA8|nr:helix-turn-helix transcriptional regulator [Caulobacter sp.]MBO9545440.1 helix-turn-helix transcriptional regulator [Caulobacter sp.]
MQALDPDAPDPVDIHVGRQLRIHRLALGVSQQDLAEALSVSFQQIQKYESGANRISASKLYKAARALRIAPSALFEGLEVDDNPSALGQFADFIAAPSSNRLAAAFPQLTAAQQRILADLVETLVS